MAKKLKRKANHFNNGGFSWDKNMTFGQNMGAAFNSGALNGAIGAAGTLIGTGLSNGMSTGVGNVMTAASNVASLIPGPVGGIVGAGLGTAGGLVNTAFGSSINQANVNNARLQNENQANRQFAFSNTADILSQSNFGMLGELKRSDIGKDGWFSNKAKRLTRQLNAEREQANAYALANFNTAVDNLEAQNDFNAMANYAAYGGPIMMRYSGSMSPFGNTFSEGGGIHIKPANRGKFTASAKRAGMGVQEFAKHVLANKDDYSSTQVKRANFARNFGGRKRAAGGPLYTHGGVWDNGLTYINNGGTHEESPTEGVQFGIDNEGVPNLVEEGEVVWNDYVFSNRLKVPDAVRSKYKLRGNKDMTFADAAKKVAKESEERPNDPISQNGLQAMLGNLTLVQENERMKKDKNYNNQGNKFSNGGDTWADVVKKSLPSWVSSQRSVVGAPSISEPSGEIKLGSGVDPLRPIEGLGSSSNYPTYLRYAPVVGAAIGLGQNLLSKPDYSNSDTLMSLANEIGNYTPVATERLGNYLTYNPFDTNYYLRKLQSQTAASRRAIANQSGGNRAASIAGLTNLDYNTSNAIGDMAMKANEYNAAQRERVSTFNRGTDQANADLGLKAAMANRETQLKANSARLSATAQALQMKDAIDARRGASLSANLTNFFDNLGNIGIDAYNRADRDMLIRSGVFGTLSEKPQDWSDKRWQDYRRTILGTGYKNGGKLKKRGGFTY